jgi:beta-glucosidase
MRQKGDYSLSDEEAAQLNAICGIYPKVILLINAGGPVDLGFLDACPRIRAVVQLSQLGMEGGNAAADVLSGKVTPSGKLTDTWALRYEDYPNAKTFSHNNGNVKQELYTEGIYVGYRYFDTFGIPVRYGFGYGLSYTDFRMELENVRVDGSEAYVRVSVKNSGEQYSGREVVQVYVSAPQNLQGKEYRRLAGFAKTSLLAPGQSETCEIHFPLYRLASYREQTADWVLDGGVYGIFVGASLDAARHVANLVLDAEAVLVHTAHICPLRQELEERRAPASLLEEKRAAWLQEACPTVALHAADFPARVVQYGTDAQTDPKAAAFADKLTTEQLILLAAGDPGKGQGSNLGSSGISVPGSAAQTSACATAQGLGNLTLADGPAGLRLQKQYTVRDGKILPQSFLASLENGFLEKESRTGSFGRNVLSVLHGLPGGDCRRAELEPGAGGGYRQGGRRRNAAVPDRAVAGAGHEHSPQSPVRAQL